ncbi:ATPase, T2SS/T4P/T4SS family [Entomomonas asaccharolytica]|uniref:Flp pilus assembly complex ATPase component TadA n=1 Tax=Entomomonas asaccharolytica TaxID=2785331 RepID=A0A974NH21_9GAMM|nr:ATPase, T2SS/T4P/T4SS family [Entomomonas asaccharolytica]QQP86412.1 Flp pilus assembly complex ATPase component TadA [Entomomonas asaccharolytica]
MNTLRADEPFLSYYQLDHDPFAARVPNFKFFPAQRKTILGQLHHLARHSQLMLLITGPKGSGKTLLRQALIASVNKDTIKIINVSAADCEKVSDVLALLAEELQATDNTVAAVIEQISKLSEQSISLYFMIDDADQLSENVIQLLLNLANEHLVSLHLFLFARPNLLDQLEHSSLVKEVTFNLPLTPYTLEETKEYLLLRLEGAGQELSIFTDEQLLEIYTKSGGWPGVINQVARDVLIENMQHHDGPDLFNNIDEGEDDVAFYAADTTREVKTTKPKLILPKKHLAIVGVIAIALVAILLFSKSPSTEQEPTIVASHYADLPSETGSGQVTQDIPLSTEVAPSNDQSSNNDTPVVDNAMLSPPTVTEPTTTVASPSQTTSSPVVNKPQQQTKPQQTATTVAQGNEWYRGKTATNYTIQVSVASNEKAAQDFIRKQSGSYQYFKRLRADKIDYVITQGEFTSRSAAQEAIKKLPAAIQESKPWVRTFASIKQELAN